MFSILWTIGNIDYATIFSLAPYLNENIVTIISICLLIGAMAKSAQIGLHVWLPMAMEGLCRALLKYHYMLEYPVLNFWFYVKFNYGKFQKKGQLAGNINYLENDSSETKCDTINLDDKFKWWFIGFTEGDGSFIINKNGYLEFKVTQSSVDAQVLFYIKKELGFGTVLVQDSDSKTHQYRVKDKDNLLKIINIFNGNVITNAKKIQFKLWLESFNNKYNYNIQYIEPNHKVNLDNAWLSGFTDAEGCFTSSVLTSKTGKNIVTVRYIISQKDDKEFSQELAILINGYITHIKSYNGYNTVVNFSKLNKILNYLNNYPLKTKKHMSYLRWLKVYDLVKNKNHLTTEGLNTIKVLVKTINK